MKAERGAAGPAPPAEAVAAVAASVVDTGPAAGAAAAAAGTPGLLQRLMRGLVRRRLARLGGGELTLSDAAGHGVERFGRPAADGLTADLEVRDPRFWRAVALGGGLGAAEAYMAGFWDSADLTALVRLLARNRAVASRLEAGLARLRQGAGRLRHAARANTRRGSRRNIEAHYDLGDELFALFLDRSMTYSAAVF